MKRIALIMLFSAGFSLLSAQETYYIKVEPSCMDRLEYHINGEKKGIEYISYRVRQSEKNYLFLEVGAEAMGYQLSAPPLVDCRTLPFTNAFVDKINKHEINLYIVRKDEIGYNVSPITLANSIHFSKNVLKYHTYDTDFQVDVESAAAGVNLANSDANNEVYFGGSGGTACLKEYYFHKISKESCKPAIGLVFVPEIGITKEIIGKSPMSEYESTLQLVRVNDVSVDTYLSTFCGENTTQVAMSDLYIVPEDEIVEAKIEGGVEFKTQQQKIVVAKVAQDKSVPASYDEVSIVKPVESKNLATKAVSKSKVVAKEIAPIKCKEVSTNDFHVVQQGETLYGIAHRYGLRVDQLQEWNNLAYSTIITPCNRLRILPKKEDAAPKAYEINNNALVAKGIEKNNSIPTAHVVKKGETYYSIAQKYGFSVEKLMKINGIIDSKPIKIGEELKIIDSTATKKLSTTKQKQDIKSLGKQNTTIFKRQTVHIVKEHETIGSIAKKFKIDSVLLARINYLEKNEALIPNQRLFLD